MNILYATDYSDNSVNALRYTQFLGERINGKQYVLHVFDNPITLASTVSISYTRKEKKVIEENTERLKAFCSEHLGKSPDDLNITLKVIEGSTASDSIISFAKDIKADLIVVGMKGGSPIREAFLGSTATNLLEKAPCPVLAVPEDITLKNIDTIIYATALDRADISAIQEIVEWAKLFNATINIVHISTKKEYAGEDQMEWFKEMLQQNVDYGKMHFELFFSEDVYEALQQYVDKISPEIIAMLEREGYSLIKSIWHRDLVKRMKTDSKIPLLSYHKKNLNLELSFS